MSLLERLIKEQKSSLKTEIFVSPANLSEQYFYWVGEGDGFTIEIKVPIPNSVVVDAFSTFFYSAFNNLLIHEIIEDGTILEEMELNEEQMEAYSRTKDDVISSAELRKQGLTFLEYAFYILWNQHDEELLELVREAQSKDSWGIIQEKLGNKAHTFILSELAKQGLEYPNSLENLIPMATDLFYYVNQLKKAKTRKIDEEGVKERLVETHRLL